MKEFIKKILFFGAFCGIFMTAIPIAIDPYNVFHADAIRDNGIEQNSNYIKMKYILENPDKFDAFLFGSSRVGSIHTENIQDVTCYNMTYSEGLPQEHLDNLKTLVANGIIPKRVYMGVDSLSYTLSPRDHQTDHSRISYEYAKENPIDFLSLYLDPHMALQSLETTKNNVPEDNYTERFYNWGWWCDYGVETTINKENAPTRIGTHILMDEVLDTIAEMSDICEENGIEFIVFTNPMHYIVYYDSGDAYFEFLEKLADVTGYYNFSGLNEITLRHVNYVDTSHYNAETGDLMLEFMSGNIPDQALYEEGFGLYVTPENIDDFLVLLEEQFPD